MQWNFLHFLNQILSFSDSALCQFNKKIIVSFVCLRLIPWPNWHSGSTIPQLALTSPWSMNSLHYRLINIINQILSDYNSIFVDSFLASKNIESYIHTANVFIFPEISHNSDFLRSSNLWLGACDHWVSYQSDHKICNWIMNICIRCLTEILFFYFTLKKTWLHQYMFFFQGNELWLHFLLLSNVLHNSDFWCVHMKSSIKIPFFDVFVHMFKRLLYL